MPPSDPQCKSAIVFLIFNRPTQTAAVFKRIAQVRPPRLLVVADGPRRDRSNESEICQEVRRIATDVHWPCEVLTNFSDANLGCRKRVATGLTWAFENVEEAIILEDDVLPDVSFFRFCDEMLSLYRNDSRISMISAFNIIEQHTQIPWSYYYSRLTHIWGWATWRRAWARYDENLMQWPQIKASGLMQDIFPRSDQCKFWTDIFDQMHSGKGPDTWDHQWTYTNLINHSLAICPRLNLVQNLGFGPDATHTQHVEDMPLLRVSSLEFPLIPPPGIFPLGHIDELDGVLSRNFPIRIWHRAGKALSRLRARIRR